MASKDSQTINTFQHDDIPQWHVNLIENAEQMLAAADMEMWNLFHDALQQAIKNFQSVPSSLIGGDNL